METTEPPPSSPPPTGHSLAASLSFALAGLRVLVRTQKHFRIHLLVTLLVTALGCLVRLTCTEWLAVMIVIGGVLASEGFNTAIELLADAVHPGRHPLIGQAKDVAAAAVLLAALTAVVVGGIVFGSRLWPVGIATEAMP